MATEGASTMASSSASESSEKSEAIKKATELTAQGKRNMVCGEVPKAVNFYEEAVQLLVKACGELSRDCADAYFNCGSALLELGRMETSVLGAALDGVDVEEEKEEEANEQFEKPLENDTTGEVGEDADAEEEENTAEDKESQEAEEVEGEDKEEDVPNFQLSWEYLDLAKVIYLKSDAVEDQLKAAECYIKLGELSMETEQHATAAEDLEQALKIQQKFLSVDDRLIAETHYQLGLAYGLGKEFELSIKHYTQAIEVIEAKIASLSKLVEAAKDDKDKPESEQVKKYQDEIKELQELIPEMRNKIEDSKEEAKDMEKMKDMAKEILGFSGSSKKFDSPTKKSEPSDRTIDVDENGQRKATDIAHLVRKKRKPDNDDLHVPNGQQTKKVRQDDSSTEVSTADTNTSSGMDVSGSDDKLNTEQNTSEKAAAEPVAC